jgi:histidyl-tRNA synthetase
LKEEFEKPLKKLTKTQGKVLIAMIERELDTSFYKVVKELRNGMIASYWNVMGKMFGYKIKKQYDPTDDPIMEAVLSDFDIDLDN